MALAVLIFGEGFGLTIKNSLQSIDVGDLCKNVENEVLKDCKDRPKIVQICANRCVLSGNE